MPVAFAAVAVYVVVAAPWHLVEVAPAAKVGTATPPLQLQRYAFDVAIWDRYNLLALPSNG